jgi:hypothetical protein
LCLRVWKLVFTGVETCVYGCGNSCLRVWKFILGFTWMSICTCFWTRFKSMFAPVDFPWKVMRKNIKWHFYTKVAPVNFQLNFHGGFHGLFPRAEPEVSTPNFLGRGSFHGCSGCSRRPLAAPGGPRLPLAAPGLAAPGRLLAAPGCSWLLLAAPGCSWRPLAAPGGPWRPLGGSWRLLAATGSSWRLLAAPGCSWRPLVALAAPFGPRAAPGAPLRLLAAVGGSWHIKFAISLRSVRDFCVSSVRLAHQIRNFIAAPKDFDMPRRRRLI